MENLYTAYLSIGSNKGDKKANLLRAIDALDAHPGFRVVKQSRFYRTQPQNFEDQDWFVNGALAVETVMADPEGVLVALKEIEHRLDPEGKAFRFGPRVVDLDLIFFEGHVLKTDFLELPHPRMHERYFVLEPMCDIGPGVHHPVLGKTTRELRDNLKDKENQEIFLLDEEAPSEVFY